LAAWKQLFATLVLFKNVDIVKKLFKPFAGAVLAFVFCQSLVFAGEVGTKAPDFRLQDAAGKSYSLNDYSGRVLVLVFWAFKCPVVLASDERLRSIQAKYRDAGVEVLAVNSNNNESPLEIRHNAANLGLPYPVLLDEDGVLAEKLKATQTPTFYVIDRQGILRYQGALDSKKPGDSGRGSSLEDALNEILAGKPVTTPETRASGCSIRRRMI
jgi:peroxiredoxin